MNFGGVLEWRVVNEQQKEVQTESKELVIDLLTTTTVKVDAARLKLLDSLFTPTFINDLDETFTMPGDLMGGTTEKSSTWYQMWVDKNSVLKLVPDLVGTADGTAAGFLVDSTKTFFTDLVKSGDKIRNRTNGTETTVSVTPVADGANLAVTDDIFVSGEDYEIRLLSPTGLDASKSLIGQVFNDGASDFTKVEKYGRARITTSFWHTVNGYGSSSNKIQKFTTEIDPSDDLVATIVNSATLGFTITANMPCKITINYSAQFNAAQWLGITKNSAQLTTGITAVTTADILETNFTQGANKSGPLSVTVIAEKGDVFRPHTDGTADGSAPQLASIGITAIEITK